MLVNEAVAALILLVATMTASRTSEEVDGESINGQSFLLRIRRTPGRKLIDHV